MGLEIRIKVAPKAKHNKWEIGDDGVLKCYLKSPPEDGKANRELIALLSSALKIPKSFISIVSGHTSRLKKIFIDADITVSGLLSKIGVATQQSLFKEK